MSYNFRNNYLDKQVILDVGISDKLGISDHIKIISKQDEIHAIYIGNNNVVYVNSDNIVVFHSLSKFSLHSKTVRCSGPRYRTKQEVISRAKSMVGKHIDLNIKNPMEFFVKWCRTGN